MAESIADGKRLLKKLCLERFDKRYPVARGLTLGSSHNPQEDTVTNTRRQTHTETKCAKIKDERRKFLCNDNDTHFVKVAVKQHRATAV